MTGIMFARVHARAVCAFARTSTYAKSMLGRALPCLLALVLAGTMAPASALAEGEGSSADGVGAVASGLSDQSNDPIDSSLGEPQEASAEQDAEDAPVAPMLASGLAGKPGNFINSDVTLDGEPVIGSFTVDGLTFAVVDESHVELVGASKAAGASPRRVVASSQGLSAPLALPDLGSTPAASETEADVGTLMLPETVAYLGTDYTLTAIAPYAFYLSGVTDVTLPVTVASVDDRAFRSSDVARVEVQDGNPAYASYDGVLYDASLARLLLIPEGRSAGVRIPYTAEEVAPAAFSHVSSVAAISVDADSPTFSSEDGLLYDAAGATLLRVPAGAVEATIREGCTAIAAGALEACAKLERINAPASVAAISPDAFHAIPTVSLPAASVILGESSAAATPSVTLSGAAEGGEVEGPNEDQASEAGAQIIAMVALSSTDADFPETDPSRIEVNLSEDASQELWRRSGFLRFDEADGSFDGSSASADVEQAVATLDEAAAYSANPLPLAVNGQTRIVFAENPNGVLRIAWMTIKGPNNNSVVASAGGANLSYTNLASHCKPIGQDAYGVYYHSDTDYFTMSTEAYSSSKPYRSNYPCLYLAYVTTTTSNQPSEVGATYSSSATGRDYYVTLGVPRKVTWNANKGSLPSDRRWPVGTSYVGSGRSCAAPLPVRENYAFKGWYTAPEGGEFVCGSSSNGGAVPTVTSNRTLYAQWEPVDFNLGFDVDSEPGDEDYPGIEKPDEAVNVEDGPTVIEDPKRPGYVFQGWTIPNAGGTEAIDQDLVYEGEDGKWYVDASKLPDYAGDDRRVELTARWTSVISVDVPSSVTFYADVVTQGNESREGLASSAFGQNKVQSQSEVDLRIVGLESKQVKGNGSTSLGASDILKKKDGSTLPTTSDKLFSLYPATGELKEDDLKNPDATSASKPEGAVDFSLDDILLEKSFAADKFSIPAGDTLSLGYRLNLQETATELDYDKLSTLSEGASASIANISYCFAADALPSDWGEPLWIENPDRASSPAKYLLLNDIKAAADDLSAYASDPTQSEHYKLYSSLVGTGAFHLKVGGRYLDVQLLGICQDTKTSGGKAGLTFQTKDIFEKGSMNAEVTSVGGWRASEMREFLRTGFMDSLDLALQAVIVPVDKHQQLRKTETDPETGTSLQKTTSETVWLPSLGEAYGTCEDPYNASELLTFPGYEPFQYQAYADGGLEQRIKHYNGQPQTWWLRSVSSSIAGSFCDIGPSGERRDNTAWGHYGIAPCFCL